MAWRMIELIKKIRCGELNYICCLTADQMIELRDGLRGMEDDDIRLIYKSTCACNASISGTDMGASTPSGGAAGEATASNCRDKFVSTMCSQTIQTTIALVDEAIGAIAVAGGVTGKLPGSTVKKLLALSAAFSAWRLACETKSVTAEVLHGICMAYNGAKSIISLLPGNLDATIANAFTSFFNLQDVVATINQCCNSPELASTTPPAWSDDPVTYILASASANSPDQGSWWGNLPSDYTVA